jgi:ABC-2 type transport system ATP-binding protein
MIIRTSGLVKQYGSRRVLDAVDLTVPEGAIYGLVGPNGAGKTTLLGLLSGLRRPTAGTLHVSVDRSRVAVLPDTPLFDPWLTAYEVVDLARGLTAPSLSSEEVDSALKRAGLSEVADRRVGAFSRGMLQRLGLAATVVGEPDLLLLDEPCSALDPAGRRDVLDLIATMAGRSTVLLSTHILSDVQQVCDHVGVLKDGRLLFQGPLDDLLRRYATPGWTVSLRSPVEPVITALQDEPWVIRVERVGAAVVSVRARSLEDGERGLAAVLASTRARVVSLVPDSLDLEPIFLELTR